MQRSNDAVLFDGIGDVVGNRFNFFPALAHRYADSCRLQHFQIVDPIAKRHCGLGINMEVLAKPGDPDALVYTPENQIGIVKRRRQHRQTGNRPVSRIIAVRCVKGQRHRRLIV